MSDSSGSIQSALCALIENVEAATRKVVDQRKFLIHPQTSMQYCNLAQNTWLLLKKLV